MMTEILPLSMSPVGHLCDIPVSLVTTTNQIQQQIISTKRNDDKNGDLDICKYRLKILDTNPLLLLPG